MPLVMPTIPKLGLAEERERLLRSQAPPPSVPAEANRFDQAKARLETLRAQQQKPEKSVPYSVRKPNWWAESMEHGRWDRALKLAKYWPKDDGWRWCASSVDMLQLLLCSFNSSCVRWNEKLLRLFSEQIASGFHTKSYTMEMASACHGNFGWCLVYLRFLAPKHWQLGQGGAPLGKFVGLYTPLAGLIYLP